MKLAALGARVHTGGQRRLDLNGAVAGRYWRASNGSTRLEYKAPDSRGITIEIRHIPSSTYYVFRPASGWTAHPMVLPTTGWRPEPVARAAAGEPVTAVSGLETRARTRSDGITEQRIPALNFLTVRETQANGTVRALTNLKVQEPTAALFLPPAGVNITASAIPAGIVALPSPRREGANR